MDVYYFFFRIEAAKHEEVFPKFPNKLIFVLEYIGRHFFGLLSRLTVCSVKVSVIELKVLSTY